MRLRTLLFVPGDRPDRFAKAAASGADAVILDLEDSVAESRKGYAADAVRDALGAPASCLRFVRINPPDGDYREADLRAARLADGVVLPKAEGADSVRRLLEALPDAPPVLPIATETPRALFALGSYAAVADRLCGLTWGAEDLPAAIGAAASRTADGLFTPPFEMVRAAALFAAHAAGTAAIETVYPDLRDMDGLSAYAAHGVRDGFTGMMALHPAQVPVIASAFAVDPAALAAAEAVVAAFEAGAGAGAVQLDGRMIDAPHVAQARRLIARSQDR